jgi:hypothetical protein
LVEQNPPEGSFIAVSEWNSLLPPFVLYFAIKPRDFFEKRKSLVNQEREKLLPAHWVGGKE